MVIKIFSYFASLFLLPSSHHRNHLLEQFNQDFNKQAYQEVHHSLSFFHCFIHLAVDFDFMFSDSEQRKH
jgi:hypothetical protein